MKRILSICVGVLLGGMSLAQNTGENNVIMQAMQDELLRNYNSLQLQQFGHPYFLEYYFTQRSNFEVSGTLGSVLDSYHIPVSASGSVRMLLGDSHRTSDFQYNGRTYAVDMPAEADYDEIRRCYWLATDMIYKASIQGYVSKMAFLRSNPKTPEEEKLDDFSKAEVKDFVEKDITVRPYDKVAWEKRIERLSAVFKKYPKLFNSSVTVSGLQNVIYKYTSEKLKGQVKQEYATLFAKASVLGCDGVEISDNWSFNVISLDEFPSDAELEKQIKAFADNLMKLSELKPVDEYYSGPILFDGSACATLFVENLLAPGRLVSWRKPENAQGKMTIDNRMGRKIIDSRLTVKNETALKTYEGKKLWGTYAVDADGIVPAKEQVLVEGGILRSLLNGRVPTLKAPVSTGSTRLAVSGQGIHALTAPGTVHIEVKDGLKEDKMKKALLKATKEEGLDYAYIVKKVAGQASLIYRVDAKTGEETQVRAGDWAFLDLSRLKRIREIAAKENVMNYMYNREVPSSLIYPASILLDDVEINVPNLKQQQEKALVFPLQRVE